MNAANILLSKEKVSTSIGQMREILNQVKRFGGYSIFWITSNTKRATAGTKLARSGIIEYDKVSDYPWCSMKINYKKVMK